MSSFSSDIVMTSACAEMACDTPCHNEHVVLLYGAELQRQHILDLDFLGEESLGLPRT